MPDSIFNTIVLQECLDRWRTGDRDAADDLLRMVIDRLEKLARRMLRSFPNIRGLADTDDVLQNSLLRLLRTLQRLRPATTRDFFNLAAVHIRRELLDLARRTRGRGTIPLELEAEWTTEPMTLDPVDTDRWVLFHQAVDRLPVEEREVVGLIFYHGWTQRRIAELFHVNERTIRRRWSAACVRIQMMVESDFLES
jgi:RNA polymerase sigma factor (sigma-70 family)